MRILALITALMAVSLPVRALEVLTTIKPLGFIAAAITDGVSEPNVLLPTGASPHDFSLRPSDIRSINDADLVVWVGPELEGFMTKPLAKHPHALTLTQVPGMPLFKAYHESVPPMAISVTASLERTKSSLLSND